MTPGMKTSEFKVAVTLIVILVVVAIIYREHHFLAASAPITAGIVSAGYGISRAMSKNVFWLIAKRILMSSATPPNIIAGAETAATNALTGPVDAAVANLVKNLKFVGPDGSAAIQALANQAVATLVTVAGDAVNYYAAALVSKL